MKYDDASWHYGGEFPDDLADEAAATHIGMFVAWALLSGLAGSIHTDDDPEGLDGLRTRKTTPGRFFIDHCDEKFTDEDLSDEGNAFAAVYYAADDAMYVDDFSDTFDPDLPSLYHVPDTWESFDRLRPVLDARHREWKRGETSVIPHATHAATVAPDAAHHNVVAQQRSSRTGCAVFAAAVLGLSAVCLLVMIA